MVSVWLCSRTLARPTSASLALLMARSSSTLAGFTSKLITCVATLETPQHAGVSPHASVTALPAKSLAGCRGARQKSLTGS